MDNDCTFYRTTHRFESERDDDAVAELRVEVNDVEGDIATSTANNKPTLRRLRHKKLPRQEHVLRKTYI